MREPAWLCEPDQRVIRSLEVQRLVSQLPIIIYDFLLEVSFFAEGGFNKLYKISDTGHPAVYRFRMAFLIELYYKPEIEVATIASIYVNTSTPVRMFLHGTLNATSLATNGY